MTNKSAITSIIILVVAVVGILAWQALGNNGVPPFGDDSGNNRYVLQRFDFSFERPAGYEFVAAQSAANNRVSFIFSVDEDEEEVPDRGEGSPALTIDIFTKPDIDDPLEWAEGNSISNIGLLAGRVTETLVDESSAIYYNWDGLYPGRSVIFHHDGNMIMISGTYLEHNDPIYRHFDDLVESIRLDD